MRNETAEITWLDTVEIVGGHPALDFVNTVHSYTEPTPRDYLESADHLIGWCRHMNLIDADQANHLARLPDAAANALMDDARDLRTTLYRLFRSHLEDTPNHTALSQLNDALKELAPFGALKPEAGNYIWHYEISRKHPQSLLTPIVFATVELLQSKELSRVKSCPPPEGCGWLFIDRSRNGRRTWCNMKTCGNVAKQRRHRARRGSGN